MLKETSEGTINENDFLTTKKYYWDNASRTTCRVGWNREVFHCIDTSDKAYWLGFILGDGCIHISRDGCAYFSIDISQRDEEYLLKFSNFIKAQELIIKHTIHPTTHNTLSHVMLCGKSTIQDLINLGITPVKSGKEQWIDTPFSNDFIRGVFDADGFIRRSLYSIGLVGSKELLLKVQNEFKQHLDVYPKKVHAHGIIYKIEYTAKSDKQKIANFLWYDGCASLKRKQLLADEIKKIC